MTATHKANKAKAEISNFRLMIETFLRELHDPLFANNDYELLHIYRREMRVLEENPKANVRLPTDSAIGFFICAMFESGRNYKEILRSLVLPFVLRFDDSSPYSAGLPQAIHVSFNDANEIHAIGTSMDIWRYNKRLHLQASMARSTRLNSLKSMCSEKFHSIFETCNKELKRDFEILENQGRGFFAAAKERRSKSSSKFPLTGETIKPMGDLKPPRYFCACRFTIASIEDPPMRRNLNRAFGIDSCAEVEAMYAIEAKAPRY
ncbi:hypothetical protein O1611_g447 [Lasiodiplodia mahajangana]|uniref:Uncharacterized protein n=1 Tax=Lasiodiplodia mahajangana TaxID=1108764 RepID=A0ACC2K0F1_9PEZI|nr:hypothetical protein O1611_g447 [Lasiodiplodia mahajangana]